MSRYTKAVRAEAFFAMVIVEHNRATKKHAPMNSLHEGYAVLLEEVDELWEEVRKQTKKRNPREVLEECVQIAAMAGRIATDVVMPEVEREVARLAALSPHTTSKKGGAK